MTTTEGVAKDKQSVIDTIRSEHRSLGQVLDLL